MRDILNDLDAGQQLSDPDPVRRAQLQMKTPLPKRFYKAASIEPSGDLFAVQLDGRPVRTPGRALLALPTEAAAALVAGEFDAQEEVIDPMTMPVLRLVNTAIDGVAADPQAVLEDILRFAASDLLCYRADGPQGLVERQNAAWDPPIDWARSELGIRFNLAEGVIHVEQPRETIAVFGAYVSQRAEPLKLAALHVMTTLTGSALLALGIEAGRIDPEEGWTSAHVDEDWQSGLWGQDAEAMARRVQRKRDFMASVSVLKSLESAAR